MVSQKPGGIRGVQLSGDTIGGDILNPAVAVPVAGVALLVQGEPVFTPLNLNESMASIGQLGAALKNLGFAGLTALEFD